VPSGQESVHREPKAYSKKIRREHNGEVASIFRLVVAGCFGLAATSQPSSEVALRYLGEVGHLGTRAQKLQSDVNR
jgi:hypothetical protein